MGKIPTDPATNGCTTCGQAIDCCRCPLGFELFDSMTRSVGIYEGASRMTLFYSLATQMQVSCWADLRAWG